MIYNAPQKHESTLLVTFVQNEILTDDRSCNTTGVNIHSGVCFDFQGRDLRANRSFFPRNLVTICKKFSIKIIVS